LFKNIGLGVLTALGLISASVGTSGQAPVVPSAQPLLQQSDLIYRGSFKLPRRTDTPGDFQYGAGTMAYNSANNSLFVEKSGLVAEIGIPALIKSSNFAALGTGTVLQSFAAVDDQNLRLQTNPSDTGIHGLLVYRSQLIVSFSTYYDANYLQTTSHLTRPLTLSAAGQGRGPFKVGAILPGHVAGHMASVPPEWQPILGGPALTGNFGLPIITRESWGPAAFVFDPAQLGLISPTPATALLDYPNGAHPLAQWDGQNNLWNTTSTYAGMAFVGGTRTLMFLGIHGTGPYCYGNGGGINPNSAEAWCYDPENGSKGNHAYPYVYRIWAYDANDLAAVKNGTKQPWEPRPYGVWDLNLPMAASMKKLSSAAYDVPTHRLFIAQGFGPADPADGVPVIHVYTIGSDVPPGVPRAVYMRQ
jgi:hypothetical protein